MKNLGKQRHWWAGWCPRGAPERKLRGAEHTQLSGVAGEFASMIVCVGSRGRRFAFRKGGPKGACAYVGVNTAAHATLSLCPLSHAQAPARQEFTCTHSRTDTFEKVCARVYVYVYVHVCVCGWVWVRARVHRRKENTCRAFTGVANEGERFYCSNK